MKAITIKITDREYTAIRNYLKTFEDKVTKADVITEIGGIVSGAIQADRSSISDHYNRLSDMEG